MGRIKDFFSRKKGGATAVAEPVEEEAPQAYSLPELGEVRAVALADVIAKLGPCGDPDCPFCNPPEELAGLLNDSDETADEPKEDPTLRGWARRGEPYNHYRTAKVVESRDGGYKVTVKGRGGRRRAKIGKQDGDGYAHPQDARKAAVKWIEAQVPLVATRWVNADNEPGDVIVDTDPAEAELTASHRAVPVEATE